MNYIQSKKIEMMHELYFAGARPPIVRYLLQINESESVSYYKQALNKNPPRGQLADDMLPFLRSYERRRQAAVLAGYMRKTSAYPISLAEKLLIAHNLYTSTFTNKTRFDFNRTWLLHRKIMTKELGLYLCQRCGLTFIDDHTLPSSKRICAFCHPNEKTFQNNCINTTSSETTLPDIFNHSSLCNAPTQQDKYFSYEKQKI